jgi:hypothetical protein
MRPDRFPKVNDVMLAEALRRLLPVAEIAVRSEKTEEIIFPFRGAEIMLRMWIRQERGRLKKLDGPVPASPVLEGPFEDSATPYKGQSIPPECERPKKPRKKRV